MHRYEGEFGMYRVAYQFPSKRRTGFMTLRAWGDSDALAKFDKMAMGILKDREAVDRINVLDVTLIQADPPTRTVRG